MRLPINNLDLLLQAHSGDGVTVNRVSREPLQLSQPAVTIGQCVQPHILKELFTPEFVDSGLTARFLMVLPPTTVGFRTLETPPIPRDVEEAYHKQLLRFCQSTPKDTCKIIKLEDEALRRWRQWERTVEKDLDSRHDEVAAGRLSTFKCWGGKLPGATARLAALLHIADRGTSADTHPLQEATMERAIRLAEFLVQHVLRIRRAGP